MTRRCCTRCRRRPPAPGHTRCRPCKNRSWQGRRPAYGELPERQREREIARAYARVYQSRGKLKPKPCQLRRTSKTPCRGPIEKHHPDYSKPLEVVWGCQRHHREEHLREAA
jgi:hypothetical protein